MCFSQAEEIIEICDDTEERGTSRGNKPTGSIINGKTIKDVGNSSIDFLNYFMVFILAKQS